MTITTKLDKDEQNKNVDIKLYKSMIDSLLYLTTSKLDIMFSVYLYTRFQFCPKEPYLIAVKCFIRYLKVLLDGLVMSEDRTIFYDEFFGCRLCRL